jgi:hypothetical protein
MKSYLVIIMVLSLLLQCSTKENSEKSTAVEKEDNKINVLLDSDANNELDDQHAIAYLLMNGQVFATEGITVNRTYNGGNIEEQALEAQRIVDLLGLTEEIPVIKGADQDFASIKSKIGESGFDGEAAVNFIIEQAQQAGSEKLVLLPIGKLTNVALALEKEPSIAEKVRIVWLGSNYPEPGEYNQDNDTSALNYLLDQEVDFEIVTVRYGKPSGTAAVNAGIEEIRENMPGKGPQVETPVVGRHGNAFTNFGDYSLDLFEHVEMYGNPPTRSLFDMAAVAVVKNPEWADKKVIPAPKLVNNEWVERPDNQRKVVIWENFDRSKIMADFYQTMNNYHLINTP